MLEVEEVLINIEKDLLNAEYLQTLGDFLREDHHRANAMKSNAVEILSKAFYKSIETKNSTCRSLVTRCYANLSYMAPTNIEEILKDEKIIDYILEGISQDEDYAFKRNSAAAISNFAHREDDVRKLILKKGGFEVLLKELEKKDHEDTPSFPHVLKGIENLLPCEESMNHFISIKGIEKLMELIKLEDYSLTSQIIEIFHSFAALKVVTEEVSKIFDLYLNLIKDDQLSIVVIDALQSYCFISVEFIKEIYKLGFFQIIIQLMKEKRVDMEGLKMISKIAEKEVYLEEFIEMGLLEVLEELSISSNLDVQKNACKILALLSLNDKNINIMIKYTDLIKKLLIVKDLEVLRFIAIMAGNLGRNDENCEKLIKEGVSKLLIDLINTKDLDIQVVGNCAFALTNLVKLKTGRNELIQQGTIESLHSILIHRSDLLEFYVLDGLSNLSFENEKVSNQIVDLGLEKIVEVLKSNDKPRIKYVAAKLLCSMYDSDNTLKEKIISSLNKEIKENIEILEKSEDKRISDMGFKFSSIFY